MKESKSENQPKLPYGDDKLYNINDMASNNDLTGLIPTPPQNEKEASSYTQLYTIPKPQSKSPKEIEKREEPPKN